MMAAWLGELDWWATEWRWWFSHRWSAFRTRARNWWDGVTPEQRVAEFHNSVQSDMAHAARTARREIEMRADLLLSAFDERITALRPVDDLTLEETLFIEMVALERPGWEPQCEDCIAAAIAALGLTEIFVSATGRAETFRQMAGDLFDDVGRELSRRADAAIDEDIARRAALA